MFYVEYYISLTPILLILVFSHYFVKITSITIVYCKYLLRMLLMKV